MNSSKYYIVLCVCIVLLSSNSCDPIVPFEDGVRDTEVPKMLSHEIQSEKQISVLFNEAVQSSEMDVETIPHLDLAAISVDGKTVHVVYKSDGQPGREYRLSLRVRDAAGNSSTVVIPWYGVNTDIPDLVINEFLPEGSGKHPDVIELYISKGGNMAGLSFYEGTKDNADSQLIFPDFAVEDDSYILIHTKPQGIDSEKSETTDITESGGYDSSDTAWDFWLEGGNGISNTNGVLSIYDNPQGNIIDALLYSTKSYVADDPYRGFGKKSVFQQAELLAQEGAWKIAGKEITPEDAIRPQDSTSTRSISRDSSSSDTNHRDDWHITPTKGASFGSVNTDEKYSK